MKLTEKAKKRFSLAGLGVVCVVLVISIALQFKPEAPKEATIQSSSTASDMVNPSTPSVEPSKAPEASVQPIDTTAASVQPSDTGDSTGTEQSIQAEVTKPTEPSQEVKTDPSKTPDGKKVTGVTPVEHEKVTKPKSTSSASTPKSGDKNEKGQIWVPGFGWVTDSGPNKGTTVDGEGDINKQVGSMN